MAHIDINVCHTSTWVYLISVSALNFLLAWGVNFDLRKIGVWSAFAELLREDWSHGHRDSSDRNSSFPFLTGAGSYVGVCVGVTVCVLTVSRHAPKVSS